MVELGSLLVVVRAVEVVVVAVVAARGRGMSLDRAMAVSVFMFSEGLRVVESVPKGGQVSFCNSMSTRSCPCSAPGELHSTGVRSFRSTFFCQVRSQIRLQSQRQLFPVRYRVESDLREDRGGSDSRLLFLRLSSSSQRSLVKAKEVIFSRARLSRNSCLRERSLLPKERDVSFRMGLPLSCRVESVEEVRMAVGTLASWFPSRLRARRLPGRALLDTLVIWFALR